MPRADVRDRIVRIYGNAQPCSVVQNHGFTMLGWLYGDGLGDMLCKAVNCGYHTDCTGATLGALLGVLGGTQGVPIEWRDPVGTGIVLHEFTRAFDAQSTLHYGGDPVLEPGIARIMEVSCRTHDRQRSARWEMRAPAGWQVENEGASNGVFQITAPEFAGAEMLHVRAETDREGCAADFAVLSPNAAAGFPSVTNIEYCPTCWGRLGSCICAAPG